MSQPVRLPCHMHTPIRPAAASERRHDAGHRQLAHRHAGDERVDEERDRQRHQQRQRAGHREQRRREGARVAALAPSPGSRASRSPRCRRSPTPTRRRTSGTTATVTTPRPPGRKPSSARANSTMRLPTPPDDRISPAKMNSGTAIRMNGSTPPMNDRKIVSSGCVRPGDDDRADGGAEQRVHQRHAGQREPEEAEEEQSR